MIQFYDSKDIPRLKDIPSVYSGINFFIVILDPLPLCLRLWCIIILIGNIKFEKIGSRKLHSIVIEVS